jgi:hypothetical protein
MVSTKNIQEKIWNNTESYKTNPVNSCQIISVTYKVIIPNFFALCSEHKSKHE